MITDPKGDEWYIERGRLKKASKGGEIVKQLLGGDRNFILAYYEVEKKDEQSAELMREVFEKLAKQLDLNTREAEALNRLRNVTENAKRWDAGLLRNNIFKAANSLGIKLPSAMF
jgi:hypothetical protein